jgi:hypothetical protein
VTKVIEAHLAITLDSSEDWNRWCTVSLLPVDSALCWVWGP